MQNSLNNKKIQSQKSNEKVNRSRRIPQEMLDDSIILNEADADDHTTVKNYSFAN